MSKWNEQIDFKNLMVPIVLLVAFWIIAVVFWQLKGRIFFYLSAGIFGGSLIHYLVAKIAGPVLFGRGYCGWFCWPTSL